MEEEKKKGNEMSGRALHVVPLSPDHVPVAACDSTCACTSPHGTSPQRVMPLPFSSTSRHAVHVSDEGQSASSSQGVVSVAEHVPGLGPLCGVAQPTEHLPSATAMGSVAP